MQAKKEENLSNKCDRPFNIGRSPLTKKAQGCMLLNSQCRIANVE